LPVVLGSRATSFLDVQVFLMASENRVDDDEQSVTIAAGEVLRFAESSRSETSAMGSSPIAFSESLPMSRKSVETFSAVARATVVSASSRSGLS
jgi:hypothetical protein